MAGALVAGAVVLALWWTGAWEWGWDLFSDRERLRRVVEEAGFLAPVVYVVLLVAQAVILPLPATPLQISGGFLFGVFGGFLLSWLGIILGAAACFGLSRALGGGLVSRSERLEKLDRRLREHGAMVVFVLGLVPVVNFDAVSYAAGLSGLSFRRFVLAASLGTAPSTFAVVYLGGASPGPGLYAALGALALATVAGYLYHRRGSG